VEKEQINPQALAKALLGEPTTQAMAVYLPPS